MRGTTDHVVAISVESESLAVDAFIDEDQTFETFRENMKHLIRRSKNPQGEYSCILLREGEVEYVTVLQECEWYRT